MRPPVCAWVSGPGPNGLDVRASHRVPVRRAGRSTQIGGENIPVAHIENVLYEHPDLADVAVASGGHRRHARNRVKETTMTELAHDYLDLDGLFSAEELELRDQVRRFVQERIKPNIAG